MEEAGRLTVVAVTIACVLFGTVGWSALGWAWANRRERPAQYVERLAKAGGALALACGIGLVLVSWTPQLRLLEALLGVVVWATVYVSTIGVKQSLNKAA